MLLQSTLRSWNRAVPGDLTHQADFAMTLIRVDVQLEGTLDLETKALGMQMKRRLWSCGMKLLGGVVIA